MLWMRWSKRLLLCLAILLVDSLIFVVPLTGLFLVYVILRNPPWFRRFLGRLDPPTPGPLESPGNPGEPRHH